MSQYEDAWQAVMHRVAAAAKEAGRAPATVRVLAVSKTVDADAVRAVHALGQRSFGENYVQEGAAKREALRDLGDVQWHLIGPLQSNKTATAAATFDWIESIDRISIAQRLSVQRPADMRPLDVCIQVDVSDEESKGGVAPDAAVALAMAVAALPNLRLRGIMGIPAPTPDTGLQRLQFRRLAACWTACRDAGLAVDTLSMGMSGDLESAVIEGSTQVRVGTAIFGARA